MLNSNATMAEIRIKISPFFLEILLEVTRSVYEHLQGDLVVSVEDVDNDPDLLDAWKSGLIESLQEDCECLVGLFSNKDFAEGEIVIEDTLADSVLRACSAIRLKLQQTFLSHLADEDLEGGGIDFYGLKPEEQRIYGCYIFLAGLQEEILRETFPDL